MASITNIEPTDLITDSRADINNNFENLNNDKIETSTLDTDNTLAADSDDRIAKNATITQPSTILNGPLLSAKVATPRLRAKHILICYSRKSKTEI